jgi:hypothetical protein
MDKILVAYLKIFLCHSDVCSFQFFFQSLENKQAKLDMISSTIELMVKKEDFNKLEDVCTLVSQAHRRFHTKIRKSLESVPLDVLQNLNLDPNVSKDLALKGAVMYRIAKNCLDLSSLFEQLKIEDYHYLRPQGCMIHLVTNEDSAQKLIDKVNELKDSRMATNSFIFLVQQEFDSSALQLYKDFENSLESEIIFNNIKVTEEFKRNAETKRKVENFVKKHGLNIALT